MYAIPFICIFEGKPASLYDRINPDWVPNLSLGDTSTLASAEAAQRYHRLHARLKRCKSPEGGVDQSIAMSDQHASLQVQFWMNRMN